MRIAQSQRATMDPLDNVHAGANTIFFSRLWERSDFTTNWSFIHSAYLLPASGIGHHQHNNCEEIFVTLDNAAQFTHNGRTAAVTGGAAVPLRRGESHAIYNHTDQETRWFNFHVVATGHQSDATDFNDNRANAALEPLDRLPIGRFDRTQLNWSQSHGGKGEIASRMVWETQDFQTNFGFLAHALMPPDTSVGYHRHDTIEECYVIMNGHGRMTVDDETLEVGPGDVILNRLGGSHGIYNHTQEELELIAVAVCAEKGKFDATNTGEDLSKR